MDLYRASNGRRIVAVIDHRMTRQELISIFLWDAQNISTEINLDVVPPLARCLQIVQTLLWLRGADGCRNEREASAQEIRYATRCAERVWNSRQVRDEVPASSR